jgi:hypothetical protein
VGETAGLVSVRRRRADAWNWPGHVLTLRYLFFGKLPFHNPDDLVYTAIPNGAFRDFEQHQTTFEGLSAFSTTSTNFKAADAPSRRRACLTTQLRGERATESEYSRHKTDWRKGCWLGAGLLVHPHEQSGLTPIEVSGVNAGSAGS